jgi:hypothetical protein
MELWPNQQAPGRSDAKREVMRRLARPTSYEESKMKLMALAATLALLVFGATPVFAGAPCMDTVGDTVADCDDNCSDVPNPGQDDTDGDDCGNICDADFDQSGSVGFADFGAFTAPGIFGGFDLEYDLTEAVAGPVGFGDFGAFTALFGPPAGPSGTTPGTVACP